MSVRQGGKVIAGNNSGRSVGDVFWTMRKSNTLNGAVMCNGATYDTDDFSGTQCIGELLESGEVPYVSLADYATALTNNGVVGVFGWDGIGTTTFRVPTLQDVFIEAGTAAQIGDYLPAGIPNIKANWTDPYYKNAVGGAAYHDGSGNFTKTGSANDGGTVRFNASRSSAVYRDDVSTVQPRAVRYRPMVQLATGATDEALETCTNVLAMMANADFVIERQDPTAENNYTWYRKYKSGWVEQGGIDTSGTAGPHTKNLPIAMNSTRYTVLVGFWTGDTNAADYSTQYEIVSSTQIWIAARVNGVFSGTWLSWQVSGMAVT